MTKTVQSDPTTLATPEAAPTPFSVSMAVDQDIRARVHELLLLMHRPAPGAERRRDKRYAYPNLVRMTPVGTDGRTPVGQSTVVVGKSLSEGGFGFFHAEPLVHRKMIASFHAGDNRWLGLLIDLWWCRFSQGWYESGGRFLQAVPAAPADMTVGPQ